MDSSKQLELFDLNLYGCEQVAVNSHGETQIKLVRPCNKFDQLEIELFSQQSNKVHSESIMLAA